MEEGKNDYCSILSAKLANFLFDSSQQVNIFSTCKGSLYVVFSQSEFR